MQSALPFAMDITHNALAAVGSVYLVGVTLVALRLGWHMLFVLDEYDWLYAKFDIWMRFALSSLLWPVTALLKPKRLFDANKEFDLGILSLGIQNQRDQDRAHNDQSS